MSELTTENIDLIAGEIYESVGEIEEKGNLDEGVLKKHYFKDVFQALTLMKQEIRLRDEFPIDKGTISKTEYGIMVRWFDDASESDKEEFKELLRELGWKHNRATRDTDGNELEEEFYFCQPSEAGLGE